MPRTRATWLPGIVVGSSTHRSWLLTRMDCATVSERPRASMRMAPSSSCGASSRSAASHCGAAGREWGGGDGRAERLARRAARLARRAGRGACAPTLRIRAPPARPVERTRGSVLAVRLLVPVRTFSGVRVAHQHALRDTTRNGRHHRVLHQAFEDRLRVPPVRHRGGSKSQGMATRPSFCFLGAEGRRHEDALDARAVVEAATQKRLEHLDELVRVQAALPRLALRQGRQGRQPVHHASSSDASACGTTDHTHRGRSMLGVRGRRGSPSVADALRLPAFAEEVSPAAGRAVR